MNNSALRDKVTTSIGTVLGVANYGSEIGFQVPQNQEDWINFGISVAIFIFGLFVKRGSR